MRSIREMLGIGPLSIDPTISKDDFMYIASRKGTEVERQRRYYETGLSGLNTVALALLMARRTARDVHKVLDFGCGHGRVLRFLKAGFPSARMLACDFRRDRVDFCASQFGAQPVFFDGDVRTLDLEGGLDLIWLGSVFTHFTVEMIARYVRALADRLSEGGLMVATTGGRLKLARLARGELIKDEEEARRMVEAVDTFGFSYHDMEPGYGQAVTLPSTVFSIVERCPDLRTCLFSESLWDVNQDVLAVVKTPDWTAASGPRLAETVPSREPVEVSG
jgi:SAM-dependent methyltransferase